MYDNVTPIDALRTLEKELHGGDGAPEGPRARIVTIHQHKGGVGKTRVAMELACVLSGGPWEERAEWNVPFIDLDATSGGNATRELGITFNPDPRKRSGSQFVWAAGDILGRVPRLNHTSMKGWRQPFLPGHPDIVESDIDSGLLSEGMLRWAHAWHRDLGSPYVVIDTPPGRGRLTDAALQAADLVVVPTTLATASLAALDVLLGELKDKGYDIIVVPNKVSPSASGAQTRLFLDMCRQHQVIGAKPIIQKGELEKRRDRRPITHYMVTGKQWTPLQERYIDLARRVNTILDARAAERVQDLEVAA